ncbi:MAG: thiamine-phosphate kinase [Chloroflexi bacterium]|nr:thiamine-phosphate kinase [Chloroflexota bacterium]
MLVRDIGEFALIDRLAQTIAEDNARNIERVNETGFRLRLSIGDDAAAWETRQGVVVLTTDTMVEGVHFDLRYISWPELGWKSIATNQSDVAAMGCAPSYAVVTLGLRGDLPVDGLLEMYRGMMDACRERGGAIVGGDIVRSPVFFLTVALEGVSLSLPDSSGQLLRRDTAKVGDKIAVTGTLGCSGGGLRMLLERLTFDDETASHLREAHNRPTPRVREGVELVRLGVRAAMDVSDGLVDDLGKLCKASGVSAVIHADSVPADDFLKRAYPGEWLDLALGGGEDYELLFTAPSEVMERVISALDTPVTVIGEIEEGLARVKVLARDGSVMPVSHGGWDHFR